MKNYAWVRISTIFALVACVPIGFAYVVAGGAEPAQPVSNSQQRPVASAQVTQLDTASPNWKPISDDLGIWVVKSDRGGMRGRLYVRAGSAWSPVAVDGEADILGLIPVKK